MSDNAKTQSCEGAKILGRACPHCGKLIQRTDLSRRERELVGLALQDLSRTDQAERLKLSDKTVYTFWDRIFVKLECKTISGAIGKLFVGGLISKDLKVLEKPTTN